MQQLQRSGDFIDFQGKTTRKIIYFLTKRLNSMVIVQRTKIPCLFFQDRARPIGDSPDRFVGKTNLSYNPPYLLFAPIFLCHHLMLSVLFPSLFQLFL